jgi:hypothetical protein
MCGNLERCTLEGSITVAPNKTIIGDRCISTSSVTFNLNGNGSLNMSNFSGVATVSNAISSSSTVGFTGNYIVTLANTLTAGQAVISGIGNLNDNSGGMLVTDKTLPSATWKEPTEDNVTTGEAIKALLAVMAGEATGGGTSTIEFKNPEGDTTRVTMTVDNDGNRSAINLNL